MIPLTVNPTVVVQIDELGRIIGVSSNVAPDLKVVVAHGKQEFNYESVNKPFVDRTGENVVQSECPDTDVLISKFGTDFLS